MQKLFVSYARTNKDAVDQLVEHLSIMGYETWVDVSLRGGQDWWEEILDRITDSDVFITVVSEANLKSTACGREFDWAEALAKPVLPVLIEALPPTALPRRISRRQIVDYSDPSQRDRAALRLQGGLGTLHRATALPQPLPEPPEAPLSYLTDLVDLVGKGTAITHDDQHQIVIQLEQALNAIDPEERRGARDILERLSKRPDLYADVDRTIARLKSLGDEPATLAAEGETPMPSQDVGTAAAAAGRSGPLVDVEMFDHSAIVTTAPPAHPSDTGPTVGGPASSTPSSAPATEPVSSPPARATAPPPYGMSQRTTDAYGPTSTPSSHPVRLRTSAPISSGRRMTAALIDVVPILVMFAVAYGIAVATPRHLCTYYSEYCATERSFTGGAAITIAAITVLGYMTWNWIYRQSRNGATVGQSALKFKMLDEAGQPPGFHGWRIARLAIVVIATVVLGLLATISLADWTIGSSSSIPSSGWTGTEST